jgi:hypothetical protein
MGSLSRISADLHWITHGYDVVDQFIGIGSDIGNTLVQIICVLGSVCEWKLIMMKNDQSIPNQCYSIQTSLNTKV